MLNIDIVSHWIAHNSYTYVRLDPETLWDIAMPKESYPLCEFFPSAKISTSSAIQEIGKHIITCKDAEEGDFLVHTQDGAIVDIYQFCSKHAWTADNKVINFTGATPLKLTKLDLK